MNILSRLRSQAFNILSWGITLILSAAMLGFAFWWTQRADTAQAAMPQPTTEPAKAPADLPLPSLSRVASFSGIERQLQLKTNIPERPRYYATKYTVVRGDSVFGIAQKFNLKPDTILWANYDVLKDDPHSLKPGQVLIIPPTDGIYYQWQENDSLEGVAKKFKAAVDDILNWPGNQIDLANPTIKAGTWVMIPGGEREYIQWLIPTVARGSSGTSNVGGAQCPGGAVGSGSFIWPADNHYLSGNDYWSGHLGIDIAAGEGAPVYAADSGVVTMAQGGWNYGYGNVIQIDHGNGYSTLYAHLSVIGVRVCQSVSAGQWIGSAGNTGNSFGAHLHFEVRLNGGFINPWYVLPPP